MIGCGIKKAIFVAIVCCILSIQIYSQDNKKDLTFADAWNYYSDQEQDLLCIGIRHGIGTVIAAMQGSLEFVESIPQFCEDHIAAIREYYVASGGFFYDSNHHGSRKSWERKSSWSWGRSEEHRRSLGTTPRIFRGMENNTKLEKMKWLARRRHSIMVIISRSVRNYSYSPPAIFMPPVCFSRAR